MCLYWQGLKDSNPHQRFWRPSCYHCTKPLYWRLQRDLNPWPPAWQAGVLLFWTMEPYWCRQWDLNPYEITPTSPSSWRVCHSTITAFITCPMGFYRIDHTGSHPWQSSQIRQERSSIVYVFSFRCSGLSEIPARILSYSVRPIRFLRTEFFVLISVYFLRFLSKIFLAQISPFLHGDAGGDWTRKLLLERPATLPIRPRHHLVLPTGLEPVLPAWEASLLFRLEDGSIYEMRVRICTSHDKHPLYTKILPRLSTQSPRKRLPLPIQH